MKHSAKRILALTLSLLLLLCCSPMSFGASSAAAGRVTLSASEITVAKSDEAQTVNVNLYADNNIHIMRLALAYQTTSKPIQLGVAAPPAGLSGSVDESGIDVTNYSGVYPDLDPTTGKYILCSLPVTIPAGASGTYTIEFRGISVTDFDFEEYSANSITATVTVSEDIAPDTPPAPDIPESSLEIYYIPNGGADSDGDGYGDFEAGESVSAEVFLLSRETDITVQAYDIYLDYSEKLSYKGHSLPGLAYKAGDGSAEEAEELLALSGDRLSHIQLISDSTESGSGESISLKKGEPLSLGSINFEFDTQALYNEALFITLLDSPDGEKRTNIALADTKLSFYPTAVKKYSGAEIMSLYDITFDANGGEGPPAPQQKEHNMALTLSESTPTRTGWSFTGWNTAPNGSGQSYAPGDIYSANAPATLYAQWKQNTYSVSWLAQDGSLIKSDEGVPHGTALAEIAPAPPTKAPDPQYSYTFAGWATEANMEVGIPAENLGSLSADSAYYAAFSKITNTYPVIWYSQDGSSILKQDGAVEFGSRPEYTGLTPTKASTAQYSFSFAGWADSPDQETGLEASALPKVDGPEAYYAAFSKALRSYSLHFTDGDSAASSEPTYYGSSIILPQPKGKEGYSFTGWFEGDTRVGSAGESYTVLGEVALSAGYAPNTYSVFFSANGGSGTPPTEISAVYDRSFTIPGCGGLEKTDYVFAGWAAAPNASSPQFTQGQNAANLISQAGGSVTLYAVWVRDVYPITYSHDPENIELSSALLSTYSSEAGLSLPQPEAVGYAFAGWTSEKLNISSPTVSLSIPSGTTGEIDLRAHWSVRSFTISFDTQGGSSISPISANYGSPIPIPNPPSKTGHTFAGWDKAIPETMPAEDTLITAKWTLNTYTITFAETGDRVIDPIVDYYGAELSPPAEPTKTGYRFAGWSPGFPTAMPAGDMLLTALWDANRYTLFFSVGEADGSIGNMEIAYDEEISLPGADSLSRPGYVLTGWTAVENPPVGTNPQYPAGSKVIALTSENGSFVTLYPVWKYAEYSLSFSTGEHPAPDFAAPDAVKVSYNDIYPALPQVSADSGYEFIGWYIGDSEIKSGDRVEITDNALLTAEYRPIRYTLSFDTKGGEDIGQMEYTIESGDTLPVPTRENYSFAGWLLEEDSEGWKAGRYDGGSSLKGKYGNVRLIAQWETDFRCFAEDYKYAPADFVLLRIATEGNVNSYSFDGVPMFYTDDPNYMLDGKAVFLALIPAEYKDGSALNDSGVEKLARTSQAAPVVERSGDINADGVLNIADANVVYQMVINGGGYYSNLDDAQRLAADMDTSPTGGANEFRGSIADVHKIVNKINGLSD